MSVSVCVFVHNKARATPVPVLTKKYVCVGCLQEKKYMAVLPELHIKQHSLYLFLLQNVNVNKEVTEYSKDTP